MGEWGKGKEEIKNENEEEVALRILLNKLYIVTNMVTGSWTATLFYPLLTYYWILY
jgi:hypothetical protein